MALIRVHIVWLAVSVDLGFLGPLFLGTSAVWWDPLLPILCISLDECSSCLLIEIILRLIVGRDSVWFTDEFDSANISRGLPVYRKLGKVQGLGERADVRCTLLYPWVLWMYQHYSIFTYTVGKYDLYKVRIWKPNSIARLFSPSMQVAILPFLWN